MVATIRCVISLMTASTGVAFAADAHWAFQKIRRPAVPLTSGFSSARNPIDYFVHAQLRDQGLSASPEAERHQLIRRLSLDLTGVPPTPHEVEEFIHDASPGAYDRLLERLMSSPRFGETMALTWMDAARYGDSGAMHADRDRAVWAWRDYVIDAFNANKPFDRFTTEQIAGDLLPGATFEQRIASAFNRHHPTSDEAGSIDEELRVQYVADRVHTTATVWLGQTMDCARCHDHPYDPISQNDYYRFFAYFNNSVDGGIQRGDTFPNVITLTRAEQERLPALHDRISELSLKVREYKDRRAYRADVFWEREHARRFELAQPPAGLDRRLAFPGPGLSLEPSTTRSFEQPKPLDSTKPLTIHLQVKLHGRSDGMLLSRTANDDSRRGFTVSLRAGQLVFRLIRDWPGNVAEIVSVNYLPEDLWTALTITYASHRNRNDCRFFVNGKSTPVQVVSGSVIGDYTSTNPITVGATSFSEAPKATLAEARIYSRVLSKMEIVQLTPEFSTALGKAPQSRTLFQKTLVANLYHQRFDPNIRAEIAELDRLHDQLDRLRAGLDRCLVMEERSEPRPTHLLERGDYDSPQRGQHLAPGVPALFDFAEPTRPDRVGLAQWLTHPRNPLTARVTANWLWQKFFGRGLVATPANFGRRGARPSHPQLLDWLATELIESGWDLRHLVRLITRSHTYRQSACRRDERDPENTSLARAPRLRLPAESIRDQAFVLSGLLIERLGGRSARPYQPPNVWSEVHLYPDIFYFRNRGEGLYRRSVYSFWHRSAPLPNMQIFDAPSRERCTMKRSRTNTPLQALVTLNDEQFVEAARAFAQSIMAFDAPDEARLRKAFLSATARAPSSAELAVLGDLLTEQHRTYHHSSASAEELLQFGDAPVPEGVDRPQLAAWTIVCQLLLNLDEVLYRN